MSWDSYSQLMQGRGLRGYYDASPLIMARSWGLLDKLWAGPQLMLILQLVLFGWGVERVIAAFRFNHYLRALLALLILGAVPVFSIVGIIWKDVWMAALFLWAMSFIINGILGVGLEKSKWTVFAGIILLAVASLYRANAIGAAASVLFFLAMVIIVFTKLKPFSKLLYIVASHMIFITAYVADSMLVKTGIEVQDSNFETVVLATDLAGISVAANKRLFDKGYLKIIDDSVTVDDISKRYTPRYHACLYRSCGSLPAILVQDQTANSSDTYKLYRNWLNAISENPGAWLEHRGKVARHILNIEGKIWAPILRSPITPNVARRMDAPWDSELRMKIRASILSNAPITHRAVYYFAMSLLLLLVLLAMVCLNAKHREQWVMLLLIVSSGVAYQITILVAATSPDYRYSHFMITCTLIALVVLVAKTIEIVRQQPSRSD